MKQSENIRVGIRSILAHKLRSALTTLGIIFGVAGLVAMMSIAEGARREAVEQIRMLGTNNIRVNHIELTGESREAEDIKEFVNLSSRGKSARRKSWQPKGKSRIETLEYLVDHSLMSRQTFNEQVRALNKVARER